MEQFITWASGEMTKHMPFMPHDEMKEFVVSQLSRPIPEINQELSNLLDFTKRDVKKFINEFLQRLEKQRQYEDEVKKVNDAANKKKKKGQKQQKRVIKDMKKYIGRKICYCQGTKHELVSNCYNCGKIVCS